MEKRSKRKGRDRSLELPAKAWMGGPGVPGWRERMGGESSELVEEGLQEGSGQEASWRWGLHLILGHRVS